MAAAHEAAISRPRIMDENVPDWADRVGEYVSTVFIAILIAMFTYGYLSHLIFG